MGKSCGTVRSGADRLSYPSPEAGRTGVEFFTEHRVVYMKYR